MDSDERLAKRRAYYLANREEICAKVRTYRSEHREELKEKEAARYKRRREAVLAQKKEYYLEHKEEHRIKNAKYRAENHDELRQKSIERHEANKERDNATCRAWNTNNYEHRKQYYADHRAEYNAHASARRALVLGATIGNIAEIKEIYRIAKDEKRIRCYLCGKLIPIGERHVDHIMPLSKGGQHRPSNLAVACKTCNLSKGAKLPSEMGVLL